MAPITLVKRDYYYNSDWYSWGKWILLAAIVLVIVGCLCIGSSRVARNRARYRLAQGQQPALGTAWLVRNAPPQQSEYPVDAAPRYNPAIGEDDAGFYDREGNFISKNAYDVNETEFQPPPGPPPTWQEVQSTGTSAASAKEQEAMLREPDAVYRSSNQATVSDYYRPTSYSRPALQTPPSSAEQDPNRSTNTITNNLPNELTEINNEHDQEPLQGHESQENEDHAAADTATTTTASASGSRPNESTIKSVPRE